MSAFARCRTQHDSTRRHVPSGHLHSCRLGTGAACRWIRGLAAAGLISRVRSRHTGRVLACSGRGNLPLATGHIHAGHLGHGVGWRRCLLSGCLGRSIGHGRPVLYKPALGRASKQTHAAKSAMAIETESLKTRTGLDYSFLFRQIPVGQRLQPVQRRLEVAEFMEITDLVARA